jgi:peptidoglycan/xylan/chitin deacetylase (PgdA/CDA1 family)
MRYEIKETFDRYGFKGNLFVQTKPLLEMHAGPLPRAEERTTLTWDELRELRDAGWNIGAHTVSHPNLSKLFEEDPSGDRLRRELDESNATLAEQLGAPPKDFAFTGTSWSSGAEEEVKQRYRFGRLWIVGAVYQVDGQEMRYADLAGVEGDDEPDGGPPAAARYITRDSDPYRLPSMEFQALIHEPAAFRAYLEGALSG